MKLQVLNLCTLIQFGTGAIQSEYDFDAKPHSLTVRTSSGTVSGKIDSTFPNVRQFLGIPYAQPPVGDLRFAPPKPLSTNAAANNIDATEMPPTCMQFLTTLPNSVYKVDVLQFNLQGKNVTGAVSEDCLTLGVWAPTIGKLSPTNGVACPMLLPVFVFLYGGGFQTGGIDVPYQLPPQWVQRTQDHIVVVLNWRLNIFGFPNAANQSSQNVGLLDQRHAVEWVHDNIRAFGGDPERLVLWGQSAGSMSCEFYSHAYPMEPLVQAMILDSGSAFSPIRSYDFAGTNFSFVASSLGCDEAGNEVACMRSLPAQKIEDVLADYYNNNSMPALNFNPIPDTKTIFPNYTERGLAGLQANLPVIMGNNQ